MKKHFMYVAAAAIALMTSCTNEEVLEDIVTPENPNEVVDDGTTRMAIELGIADPTFTVSTRGTGTVGDIQGQTTNVWNGQPLGIFMVKKDSMILAQDQGSYIFDGMTFRAPVAQTVDKIVMYHASENVKYYPLQGAFDFYGYHLGNKIGETANVVANNAVTAPVFADDKLTATVTTTIDGTQDIMAGKAELTETQKGTTTQSGQLAEADYKKAYSSWSARRDITPNIKFNHLLSRMVFQVTAGEDEAGLAHYASANQVEWHDATGKIDETTGTLDSANKTFTSTATGETVAVMNDQAVYIKEIVVKNQKDSVVLTFNAPSTNQNAVVLSTGDRNKDFTLMERNTEAPAAGSTPETDGDSDINLSTLADLVALTETAPANTTDKTRVGESMMIAPGQESFEVSITVRQYVQKYDDPAIDGPSSLDKFAWEEKTMATTVKAPEVTEDNNAFAAGKSYNINVTVYGYQRIEITAKLAGWIAGGDVPVDPEEDAFN